MLLGHWEKDKKLREYVTHVLDIYRGKPDSDLLTKSQSLDSVLDYPMSREWMNFIGAAHDENQVQMQWSIIKDQKSPYHTKRFRRESILSNMFGKYDLLNYIPFDKF